MAALGSIGFGPPSSISTVTDSDSLGLSSGNGSVEARTIKAVPCVRPSSSVGRSADQMLDDLLAQAGLQGQTASASMDVSMTGGYQALEDEDMSPADDEGGTSKSWSMIATPSAMPIYTPINSGSPACGKGRRTAESPKVNPVRNESIGKVTRTGESRGRPGRPLSRSKALPPTPGVVQERITQIETGARQQQELAAVMLSERDTSIAMLNQQVGRPSTRLVRPLTKCTANLMECTKGQSMTRRCSENQLKRRDRRWPMHLRRHR